MSQDYQDSLQIISQLGCSSEYFYNPSLYWFDPDPSLAFLILHDGSILVRSIWHNNPVSIYELWKFFNEEQQKLIIYNLDKFV